MKLQLLQPEVAFVVLVVVDGEAVVEEVVVAVMAMLWRSWG